ncbi:MAG: hypothetical protein ACRBCK_11575 [Alphaproteobacteria bacterium]
MGIKTRIGKVVRKKFKESLYLAIVPAIIGGSFLIWNTYLSNSPDSNEKTVQSIAYSSGNNSSAVSEVVTNNIDARIVASDKIGSSECEVGIKCRLENSQSNLNSGSVLIERVGE